jgi:hypothetical protein
MSIRIQNDLASDIGASQASRPDSLTSSTSSSGNKTSGLSGVSGDSVEVSSSALSISTTLEQHNAGRAERVSQLASLYASGRYDGDAAQTSHAIVSNAISGVSGGSGH